MRYAGTIKPCIDQPLLGDDFLDLTFDDKPTLAPNHLSEKVLMLSSPE
jgi:hypothetical protein